MCDRWKRYGGAAALGFCGYLTIATSAIEPPTCATTEHAGQVAVEVDTAKQPGPSRWEVVGISPTPVIEWRVETSGSATLEYVQDEGAPEIPVLWLDEPPEPSSSFDTGLLPTAPDAGLFTDADRPDAFVQEFPGGLRIVCGRATQPCQTVHFTLIPGTDQARRLTLTAHAFTSGCTQEPPVRELTLTPWQP